MNIKLIEKEIKQMIIKRLYSTYILIVIKERSNYDKKVQTE